MANMNIGAMPPLQQHPTQPQQASFNNNQVPTPHISGPMSTQIGNKLSNTNNNNFSPLNGAPPMATSTSYSALTGATHPSHSQSNQPPSMAQTASQQGQRPPVPGEPSSNLQQNGHQMTSINPPSFNGQPQLQQAAPMAQTRPPISNQFTGQTSSIPNSSQGIPSSGPPSSMYQSNQNPIQSQMPATTTGFPNQLKYPSNSPGVGQPYPSPSGTPVSHSGVMPPSTVMPSQSGMISPNSAMPPQPGLMQPQMNKMPPQSGMMQPQMNKMPPQSGMMPQQPGMMPQQPGMMPQQPGMMPQQPGMMPQQPGMMAQGGMRPPQPGMAPQGGMMPPSSTMPPHPQQLQNQQYLNQQPGYPQSPMGQFPQQPGMGSQYPASPMQAAPQRRLDPDQMPNPIQVMAENQRTSGGLFSTALVGQVPPLVTTNFVTQDQGNSGPRYVRSTMYNVPANTDMMKQSAVPFALVVSPMAREVEGEMIPPIVDFGEVGPIRCIRCKAYMSPYMQFIDAGRRFQCLLCKASTEG
jgi:protein transport protein SEC24